MILASYIGDNYKCILDSKQIEVHPRITRLVGQNEAGKTALLELLSILRPVDGRIEIFPLEDYPRVRLAEYKRTHATNPHSPMHATFKIGKDEIEKIEAEFGKGIFRVPTVTLSKRYESKGLFYNLQLNERAYVKHVIEQLDLGEDVKVSVAKATTAKGLQVEIGKLKPELQSILEDIPDDLSSAVFEMLELPYFFYFDEYATLPGEISLQKLKQFGTGANYVGEDAESLRTAKALIEYSGATVDEFLNRENYERLKANLESASNAITDQLSRFWTTNPYLEISFDLTAKLTRDNRVEDTLLHVRVKNTKHRVTVPFAKRSKGFVWFFSFLVAFSEYRHRDEEIILLLDEPGMNLGAIAQRDLMRYFEEELAPHHQILYTTHSPFMIDVQQLDTVRTVEDVDKVGTQVSNDPFRHSAATLFPLQAALGYDLTQTFFVAPNNLLVEGPGDLIYLRLASQVLMAKGRTSLDDDWTIVPVGGADKVASFVSLLGGQGLNIAVFLDVTGSDQQRFDGILKSKLMVRKNLLTVGSILNRVEADIEDLFSIDAFVKLVNLSYAGELKKKLIKVQDLEEKSPRLVKRFELLFAQKAFAKGKFSHYKPAYDLMNNPKWIDEIFDDESLANFESAFRALNALLNADSASHHSLPVKRFKNTHGEGNS